MLGVEGSLEIYANAILAAIAEASAIADRLSEDERQDLLERLAVVRSVVEGRDDHSCTQRPMALGPDAARAIASVLAPLPILEDQITRALRKGDPSIDQERFAQILAWLYWELRKPLFEAHPDLEDLCGCESCQLAAREQVN